MAERDAAADAYIDRDLIFCNELGESLHPWSITRPFAKVRKSAGIRPGSCTTSGNGHATHLLKAGVPVTHRLGETRPPSPMITSSGAAHMLPTSDVQAAEVMAAVLD